MSTRGNLQPTAPEETRPQFGDLEMGRFFAAGQLHVGDDFPGAEFGTNWRVYDMRTRSRQDSVYFATLDNPLGVSHLNPALFFGGTAGGDMGLPSGRLLQFARGEEGANDYLQTVDLKPTPFQRPRPDPLVISTGRLIWPTMAHDDVVTALRRSRFKAVAERLDFLYECAANDPVINEINPESVTAFGKFLLVAQPAALPSVGLDQSGHVLAQWKIASGDESTPWSGAEGSIVSVFEPTDLVHFTAKYGAATDDNNPVELNGAVPVQALASTLHFFLAKAAPFGVDDDDTSMAAGDETTTDADPSDLPATVEEGIRRLRASGLMGFAERLEGLQREIEDDPDESPISLESLAQFSNFVGAKDLPGFPSVWVDPYGNVGLEWRIPDPERLGNVPAPLGYDDDHLWGHGDGILAMVFLPNDTVKLAGTSGPVGRGVERRILSETVSTNSATDAAEFFLRRMGDA